MKATLTNYRQSPRKVALVAGLIRGKKVSEALTVLRFAVKRASSPMEKLLRSAIANAKNAGITNPEDLFVDQIRVDKGIVLKRYMPRARGSSAQILKRSSNVFISLVDKAAKKAEVKEGSEVAAKATKTTKAKAEKVVKEKKTTKTKK